MEKTLKEIKIEYEDFMNKFEERLLIAKQIIEKEKFDYSFDEINMFGDIYSKYFKGINSLNLSKEKLKDVIATYLGHTWLYYFGGKYELDKSKSSTTYGKPIIIDWGPENYPWVRIYPHEWLDYIEEGDEEPISLPYDRKKHYFTVSKDWNNKFKKDKYE